MKKVLKNKKMICLFILILLLLIGSITFMVIKKNKNKDLENITQEEPMPEEKYYKILFDTNGGSYIDSLTIKEGDKLSKPENPTRDGYEFVAWLSNEEEYDFETPIQEDITLKASWKKIEEKESTTKETTTSKKSTTSKTTSSSSSTIDKINLNDYISVTVNYYNYAQPRGYYFITNLASVFPEFAGKTSITVGFNDDTVGDGIDILLKDWEEAVNSKFTYDTAKEANAKNTIEKINKENKKGILFTPQIDNHGIDYQYEYLTISNTSYKSLNNALVESKDSIKSEIGSIFSGAIRVTLPGYGVYPKHDKLLTEDVCNEYHLTCSRW